MAEPTLAEEDADELPQSPEFGQLNVVVTPPAGSPVLPTPEFGESSPTPSAAAESPLKGSADARVSAAKTVALPKGLAKQSVLPLVASQATEVSSPNFGGDRLPSSPTFGDDGEDEAPATDGKRARRPSTLEEPEVEKGASSHPATPDFGSLEGPLLDDEAEDLQKLGSASSSPPGSSPDEAVGSPSAPVHRNSVDMLLPSPGDPGAKDAGPRPPGTRFNFRSSDPEASSSKKAGEEEEDEEVDEDMVRQLLETEQYFRSELQSYRSELQSHQRELVRRDRVLSWYHDELLSTQDELEEAKLELQEQRSGGDAQFKELLDARRKQEQLSLKLESLESGRSGSVESELQERCQSLEVDLADREERLESCRQRLKEEIAEQSIYGALKQKLAEAEKLQQEVNGTLRLENDDLAFDVRSLRVELAASQRLVAEESASLRVSQQEAAALGDALERAEGQALGRAAASLEAERSWDSGLALELDAARRELAAATAEASTCQERLRQQAQEPGPGAAALAAAAAALAESRADVEAATAEEWRAAEAFDKLADVSRELEHVKLLAAADRNRHAEALAAVRADAERELAAAERQAAAMAAQLQTATASREAAEGRLARAEAKVDALPAERRSADDALEAKLAAAVSARERAAAELADARATASAMRREAQEEALAKRETDQRLVQAQATSRTLSARAAAAATSKADTEAHLTEVDEERLDLQRQLEREGRRRSSLSLRLEEAEHDAESSGGRLAAAMAARQALESRLAASEAVTRKLEASLANAEAAAADSGSQSAAASSLKVRLGDATELSEVLRSELSADRASRARVEGQLRQQREHLLELEKELDSRRDEVTSAQAKLSESHRRVAEGKEEAAALRLTVQQMETRLASLQGASAALDAQLAAESKGKAAAEEALSSLRLELVHAAAVRQRLEASEAAEEEWCLEFAAALAAARDVEEAQQTEIAELRTQLFSALQQRRAAMQASERAQAARVRHKEQAVAVEAQALKLKAQSELRGEVLSASMASVLEESGAIVREQHAELLLEVRALSATVARGDGELRDSQEELQEMKHQLLRSQSEARDATKTAATERECCEMLLHQLEEITLQSISTARADPPEVQRLRDELAALQVRHLQSEAASVKNELQDVRGATRALASFLGVHYGGSGLCQSPVLFPAAEAPSPPRRRMPAAGFEVPHVSTSVCGSMSQVGSPLSACRSRAASRSEHAPLPWGPPPAVVKDLPFSSSNSPASGSWRQDRPRACGSTS